MVRVHNINEEYSHYQHRIHTENFMIWKVMTYVFLIGAVYFLFKMLSTIGADKTSNTFLFTFALIASGISYLISKFNKWKRGWSWISR